MDLGLGELKLKRAEILRMTWGDFWRVVVGHRITQDQAWDRTRQLVAIIYNTNRDPKRTAAKSPSRLIPLAIDKMGRKLEWTEDKYQDFERALIAWDFSDEAKQKRKQANKQHKKAN